MKHIKIKAMVLSILFCFCTMILCDVAYAAEITTITVEAEDYESGVYMYALDSTDEGSWQLSNQFSVPAGTTHTVYVKDEAGNITSTTVYAAPAGNVSQSAEEQDTMLDPVQEQPVNESFEGVGTGTGTITDFTADKNSQEFYTVTASSGNNYYLIIDHRGNDQNVYLTKPVSDMDLLDLAKEAGAVTTEKIEEVKVEIPALKEVSQEDIAVKSDNPISLILIVLIVMGIAGGAYYYFNIYQKKKVIAEEDMDALDMDNFEAVDDEDDYSLFSVNTDNTLNSDAGSEEALADFFENNSDFESFELETLESIETESKESLSEDETDDDFEDM